MTQKEKIMSALKCTEAEALEIMECDKAIDRGADPFPLSAEQQKAEKKMRQADRKPTVYKLDNTGGKRSKKADTQKQLLIDVLSASLTDHTLATNLEIINPEREFTFEFLGKKYKVVLSAPRS